MDARVLAAECGGSGRQIDRCRDISASAAAMPGRW